MKPSLLDRFAVHLGATGLCAALSGLVIAGVLVDRAGRGGGLDAIQARGVLTVATYNSPVTFYDGRDGPAGFELDLARAYADHLGVALRVVVRESEAELFAALDSGEADLAAAGLLVSAEAARERRFGPPYRAADVLLVCGAAGAKAAEAGEAADELRSEAPSEVEPMSALAEASSGTLGCVAADEARFALAKRYHPNLRAVDVLAPSRPVAWALPRGRGSQTKALSSSLRAWFAAPETAERTAALAETYFVLAPEAVDDAHAAAFRRAIRARLPRYERAFRREAERAGVPWSVLAAVAYQESHWDAGAVSPTGVRGLMMLTETTAGELGVADRADPAQSLRGGARYLRSLYDRAPPEASEAERWWFAAAAYNIGFEHVKSAREAAALRGLDDAAWASTAAVLEDESAGPFAAASPGLKRRARTAALYVRRVRDYADVLEKRDARPLAGLDPAETATCAAPEAAQATATC